MEQTLEFILTACNNQCFVFQPTITTSRGGAMTGKNTTAYLVEVVLGVEGAPAHIGVDRIIGPEHSTHEVSVACHLVPPCRTCNNSHSVYDTISMNSFHMLTKHKFLHGDHIHHFFFFFFCSRSSD